MKRLSIEEILRLREKEDRVEFKEAKNNFTFEGGGISDFKKRRKCILGYVVALGNEGGGKLILGIKESSPTHIVVGTNYYVNDEGALTQKIYEKLRIRVDVYSLADADNRRVLIIDIPSRPIGKVFTFEDTALMRVGDQLSRMDDDIYFNVLSEQEPDFTATIVIGATLDDLDTEGIAKLKSAYADKQNNKKFPNLTDSQALSDLDLMSGSDITYAALILLGKKEAIAKYLPQASIRLEFRNKSGQIVFDKREVFEAGYFREVDRIWQSIDVRNGVIPVQKDSFIYDIPYFNYEVIREAINNAIAHRDYKLSSEIVIKLYHTDFTIISPGGFPKGVNLDNIINVSSTPRNRMLADVLSKTGAVERSGQGVDKIFFQSLAEAKGIPDYSYSDDFQVELRLSGLVKDKAFALFIKEIQRDKESDKLSVHEIITLDKIRSGVLRKNLDKAIIDKLIRLGYVEKLGKTNSQSLRLAKIYYEFMGKKGQYTVEGSLDPYEVGILIQKHLETFKRAKMSDFRQLLCKYYTKSQIKYLIYKLAEAGFIESQGKGSGTYYIIGQKTQDGKKLFERAFQLGIQKMIEIGEIDPPESDKKENL